MAGRFPSPASGERVREKGTFMLWGSCGLGWILNEGPPLPRPLIQRRRGSHPAVRAAVKRCVQAKFSETKAWPETSNNLASGWLRPAAWPARLPPLDPRKSGLHKRTTRGPPETRWPLPSPFLTRSLPSSRYTLPAHDPPGAPPSKDWLTLKESARAACQASTAMSDTIAVSPDASLSSSP